MSGPDVPGPRRGRRGWKRAVLSGGLLLLTSGLLVHTSGCALAGQAVGGMDHRVADASAGPSESAFERTRMARSFQAADAGGVEQVVARDPSNEAQITQVRAYLRQEAARFEEGRYEDPAKIHGMEMPGSKELEAGYGRVQVTYADLPNGGQVTYSTPDQTLIQAIHAWFGRRQMGA